MQRPRLPFIIFSVFVGCSQPDTKIVALTPDLVVAPEAVEFGDVVKLYTAITEIQIINSGRAPLEVSEIELEIAGGYTDVFTVPENVDSDELFATVAAGETLPLALEFRPHKYMDYRARVLVHSDDMDQPVLAIPITGTGVVGATPDIHISALSVDFGTVPTNSSETAYFAIQNIGDGDLEVAELVLEEGPFSIVVDPSGQTIDAGAEFTVIAEYTPTDDASGHAEDLIIRSNDPDEPEVSVVLFGGNGGDDYQPPIAKIDCEALQDTAPPTTVALRAPESDDPEDEEDVHALSYAWELIGRPELSRTYIMNPNEEAPDLYIDVAGVYEVQLVVTDFNGVASEPDVCSVNVIPDEDLYIAMSWDTNNSDIDLHLVPSGMAMWGPKTCFHCCQVPIWPSSWGIPVYALDNTIGYGPENINVSIPGNEKDFYIRAHYYSDRGGGETEVTISIYIDGVLAETRTNTLPTSGHRWKVGYVTFDGPFGEDGRVGTFVEEDIVEPYGSRSCPDC